MSNDDEWPDDWPLAAIQRIEALEDKLDETLKGLKDPATVWANMLRGEIARPTALEHYERMARDIERLEDTERRRNDWLHKAKQEWGADDRVSFDVVWKEALELKSRLDSLRQNLAVAHSILNDAMAEQDYHVDVSRTAVWLASNEGVVERQLPCSGGCGRVLEVPDDAVSVKCSRCQ